MLRQQATCAGLFGLLYLHYIVAGQQLPEAAKPLVDESVLPSVAIKVPEGELRLKLRTLVFYMERDDGGPFDSTSPATDAISCRFYDTEGREVGVGRKANGWKANGKIEQMSFGGDGKVFKESSKKLQVFAIGEGMGTVEVAFAGNVARFNLRVERVPVRTGDSHSQVLRMLGKPDQVEKFDYGWEFWRYSSKPWLVLEMKAPRRGDALRLASVRSVGEIK